jgi:hypothetical protein
MAQKERKPTIDQERVEKVYGALSTMDVALDADPLAFGPKRINTKVYEVRALLSRLERMYLSVAQDLQWFKHKLRKAEAVIELTKHDLFASDPEVRAGRNVADREAMASVKMRAEIQEKIIYEDAAHELEGVMTVVKAKRTDLKDIQGRLRDQIKLCQEEISLGSHWGSKVVPGTDVDLMAGHNALADIDGFLDNVEGEFHVEDAPDVEDAPESKTKPEDVTPTAAEVLPPTSEEAEVDGFLDDIEMETLPSKKQGIDPPSTSPVTRFADEGFNLDDLISTFD